MGPRGLRLRPLQLHPDHQAGDLPDPRQCLQAVGPVLPVQVHPSTSTTGCSPSTPATPTGASSSTPTSCPVPAPATSPRHPKHPINFLSPKTHPISPKIPQPTVTEENHGPHVVLVENLPKSYLFLFIFSPKKRTCHLLASAPNGTAQHLGLGLDGAFAKTVIKVLPFLWCELL